MRGARSCRPTGLEIAIRQRLHARGLRYGGDARPREVLRRRADVVFRPAIVAVFMDGCFWHCCPSRGTIPATNADYWIPKLARNVERDTDHIRCAEGWRVVRVWEHQDSDAAARRIERAVRVRLP